MPQANSNFHANSNSVGVKFQTGEWITLYASVFMTLLVAVVISYYKFVAPAESAWRVSKRKKHQ